MYRPSSGGCFTRRNAPGLATVGKRWRTLRTTQEKQGIHREFIALVSSVANPDGPPERPASVECIAPYQSESNFLRKGNEMAVMTTRARTVVLVVALALAASLLTLAVVPAKPAQAQAETVTDTERVTFSGDVFSPCSGEVGGEIVHVEGTVLTVAQTTIDANGGIHTKLQFNAKGKGEGLDSGDKYVYHQVFSRHANFTGAHNETLTQTFKIIRQGSVTTTDDFNARLVIHVTVNANGDVTTEFLRFEEEPCT
jgi:hypothetical protein